jgi:dimethylhistidine N-methyltransferase
VTERIVLDAEDDAAHRASRVTGAGERGAANAVFHDLAPPPDSFCEAIWAGFAAPRKFIPCRFLYDARGSALFERICELPEYYPTRTEIGILEDNRRAIAACIGREARLIEFGSGASRKVRTLLAALAEPRGYVAIDISRDQLRRAADAIARDFPALEVVAICADYGQRVPPAILGSRGRGRRVGFFPGSTIGNLEPDKVVGFLAGCAAMLGAGGGMVVGVDLKKDRRVLEAAYNDAAGVTAAFNLNLLVRANRELAADFDLRRFAHQARYDAAAGRITIEIRSLADQVVTIAGRRFGLAEGEAIHTENSYKYTTGEFRGLAAAAGFRAAAHWTDPAALFSVHYLEADFDRRRRR